MAIIVDNDTRLVVQGLTGSGAYIEVNKTVIRCSLNKCSKKIR